MDDDVDGVDPYADPTTGVLANKLGIGDAATLAEAEDDIVTAGLEVLRTQPISGGFDSRIYARSTATCSARSTPGRASRAPR